MRLKGKYLLLKASFGGGAVFWRSLMSSIKDSVDVVVIPLHKKSSMYLIPDTGIDKYKIPHYSILVAEVVDPDFSDWCDNIRYDNECKVIKVVKKRKKVKEFLGPITWEREIEYLEIYDGDRRLEIYANAHDARLARTQAAKVSETKAAGPITASETYRWSL